MTSSLLLPLHYSQRSARLYSLGRRNFAPAATDKPGVSLRRHFAISLRLPFISVGRQFRLILYGCRRHAGACLLGRVIAAARRRHADAEL